MFTMKKTLRVLLAVLTVLTMLAALAGCGEEPAPAGDATTTTVKDDVATTTTATDTTTTTTTVAPADGLPAALSGITKIDVPSLDYLGWELSGGMVDGVEMEEADVQTVLDNFGGLMQFIFLADNAVILSNGQDALESTYEVTDNVLFMDFNEYKYHAVFTEVSGVTVMIVANDTDPNSALYFTVIDEH